MALLFLSVLLFFSPPQTQLCGQATWLAGNQMPSIGSKPASKGMPIRRQIYVYEVTNQNEAVLSELGFYTHVKTRLVKKIWTDRKGKYCIALPAGQYSVFTKEPRGLWANSFDGEMNINGVKVEKNKQNILNIEINYAAVF